MHIKTRILKINDQIDKIYFEKTGKIANQNCIAVTNLAKTNFNIDDDKLAGLYFGFEIDGIDSEKYVTFCENQLNNIVV